MTPSSTRSRRAARALSIRWFAGALLCRLLATGCSVIGPRSLKQSRLQYNEVVKVTSEEEMLLNIVRLRYVDTPSSLQISNIAAQFELVNSLQLTPFFVASGAEPNRSFTSVLPQASIGGADRPTFSLTPLDESEFAQEAVHAADPRRRHLPRQDHVADLDGVPAVSGESQLGAERASLRAVRRRGSPPSMRVPRGDQRPAGAAGPRPDRVRAGGAERKPRRSGARRDRDRIERDRRGQGRQRVPARPGRARPGRSTGKSDSPSCSSIRRPSARPKWRCSPARSA